jgi:hypothetical protein
LASFKVWTDELPLPGFFHQQGVIGEQHDLLRRHSAG